MKSKTQELQLRDLYTMDEIFSRVCAKFGVSTQIVMVPILPSWHPLNVPRKVGTYVCKLAGYTRTELAQFTHRKNGFTIRQVERRVNSNAKMIGLAWGCWKEMGGQWSQVQVAAGLVGTPEPKAPPIQDYELPGFSHVDLDYSRCLSIPEYFDASEGLSKNLIGYFGLNQNCTEEKGLAQALIVQAITDYLTGVDAKRWIDEKSSPKSTSLDFGTACRMVGLSPAWLKSKLEKIAKLVEKHHKQEFEVEIDD